MTLSDFVSWEERQDLRWEFDGFQPVAMTGGTAAHAAVQRNLIRALGNRLDGKPCQVFGSDLKVQVAGRIRYPDAFVVCSHVDPRATVITDPVIVFEVLSESTAGEDVGAKNAEYRATPSVRRYVILQQDRLAATVFSRKGEDWVTEHAFGADAVLRLPECDVVLPLLEVYADVESDGRTEPGSADRR